MSDTRSILEDAYLTHLPALVGAVLRTQGDVLELGCGKGSTQVLHEICEAQGRRLVSADSDLLWVERLAFLRSDLHQIIHVSDWTAWKLLDEREWGVAFVDHSPAEHRRNDVVRLQHLAHYIVVHDSDDACCNYESVLSKFRYRREFGRDRPSTAVVSNFEAVWS